MRTIFLISLLIVTLVSCSSYSELLTTTTIPTKTKTPSLTPKLTTSATLSVNATPSSTPDFATQILFSPNSKFVAKRYDVYSRPSLEKSVIEILDEQGMLLWQIPYQGEMPSGDPHRSLSIYKWANDNSALYFYYSFQYDGYHTLSNGFNLQKLVHLGINKCLVKRPVLCLDKST